MNKHLHLLLFLLGVFFSFTGVLAQDTKFKINEITIDDLKGTTCTIDSTAPAFVFFDKGDIEFIPCEGTFDVLYNRILRIKILRKEGIGYGELVIPIYTSGDESKRDDIREIKATTYNLVDEKISKVKVDPKTIFMQKINDHLMIQKFAFPDVHEGSILEIRYEVRSPFKFRLNDWYFQWGIPVLHSECNLKYTPFYLYTYLLKNATRFDEYEEYQVDGLEKEFYNTTYEEGMCHFVMKNVPAFKETDFVSSDKEYLITLHFQLHKMTNTRGVSENTITTWDELAEDLSDVESFGKYLSSSRGMLKQIFPKEQLEALTPAAKFDTIVTLVKKNFSWDQQGRIFAEHKVKDVLKRKTGSSSEINLLLCGLLQEAGIEANPVLISTQGNPKVYMDYPFLGFFNYVMVAAKIDEKWVLTDATEPFCANNTFPARCANGSGMMVNKKRAFWVEIPSKTPSTLEDRIRLSFLPGQDSLRVNLTRLATGYYAIALRNNIGTNPEEATKYMMENGFETGDSIQILNASVSSISKPYTLKTTTRLPVNIVDEMPQIDPFCGLAIDKNPFEKPVRKVPVDLNYPRKVVMSAELEIPDGYRIKKLPETITRDNELMSFSYISSQVDGKIIIHASYLLKNAVYPAEGYKKLRQFYALILKKLQERIYLEKTI